MSEAVVDDIVAVLPPLLQSLEALGFIARHLNPPQFDAVMEAAGTPDQALQATRARLTDWPEEFAHLRAPLETASDAALAAFAALRAVQNGNGDLVAVFRALRHAPRALEALYPLTRRCRRSAVSSSNPAGVRMTALLARLREANPALKTPASSIPQRPEEPRRLLDLRAGILQRRTRLAAGHGAARRQRPRQRLPVELGARVRAAAARSWWRRPPSATPGP